MVMTYYYDQILKMASNELIVLIWNEGTKGGGYGTS